MFLFPQLVSTDMGIAAATVAGADLPETSSGDSADKIIPHRLCYPKEHF